MTIRKKTPRNCKVWLIYSTKLKEGGRILVFKRLYQISLREVGLKVCKIFKPFMYKKLDINSGDVNASSVVSP